MGRLNLDYIKYILKNKLIKIIPYKYRKPFILVFAVFVFIRLFQIYDYAKCQTFWNTKYLSADNAECGYECA